MLNIILSILFQGMDFFLKRFAADEQSKMDYIAFLEIMSRKGIKSASNRLAAQEQIDAVKKLWDKEKKAP